MDLVRRDVRPSSIVTREALENGIASVAATGGSTNGVLHLLAIAHEYGIPLDIDEFGAIADRTPLIGDMRPGGRYTATDMYEAGGVGLVMRELLKRPGLLHGDAPTVDGRTIAEIAAAVDETPGQQVVVPIETPLKPTGGLAILHGSLAPEGCVVKLAGHERRQHRGPARVFDSEAACYDAVRAQRIKPGDVVVIRYEGPVGGPGHAGDAAGHRRARRRGPRRLGRAADRRPVLRRDPRPDDRPRRARRRRSAARSRSSRRATGSSSTSIASALDLDVPADEVARGASSAGRRRRSRYRTGVHGQVRGARRVGLRGGGHDRAADDAPASRRTRGRAEHGADDLDDPSRRPATTPTSARSSGSSTRSAPRTRPRSTSCAGRTRPIRVAPGSWPSSTAAGGRRHRRSDLHVSRPSTPALWGTWRSCPTPAGRGSAAALLTAISDEARTAGKTDAPDSRHRRPPGGIDFLLHRGFDEYERAEGGRAGAGRSDAAAGRAAGRRRRCTRSPSARIWSTGSTRSRAEAFLDIPGGDDADGRGRPGRVPGARCRSPVDPARRLLRGHDDATTGRWSATPAC